MYLKFINYTKCSLSICQCSYFISLINELRKVTLQRLYFEYDPDVIGYTESWTIENHLKGELELEGYTSYRKDIHVTGRIE